MKSKIIFVALLCMIFLAGTVAAAEWDNVKSYDTNTRTATIKNLFGIGADIATVQLKTPQVVRVAPGYQKVAEFQIKGFTDYKDFIGQMEFYDLKKGKAKINRNYDLKYKTFETVTVNDYKKDCSDVTAPNGTISNICTDIKTGSHTEQKVVWKKITPADIKKNDVLTVGIFTDVKIDDYVDWLPSFAGVKVPEWAAWTADLTVDMTIYYSLNETSNPMIDATDNINGTANGGASNVAAKVGNGEDFDGSGGAVYSDAVTGISGTMDRTFCAWINPDTVGANDLIMEIGENGAGHRYSWTFSGGAFRIEVDSGGQTFGLKPDTAAWQLACLVYNGTSTGSGTLADAWLFKINATGNYTEKSTAVNAVTTDNTVLRIGNGTNAGYYFDGKIDEAFLANRSWGFNEVYQIWNGGAGSSYPSSFNNDPTVTAIAPANNTFYTTSPVSVDFTCYGEDDINFTQMEFYLNGSLSATNSSGLNATNYTFTRSLADGNYNWSCTGYDNDTLSTSTGNLFLTVDSLAPYFVVNSPISDQAVYNLPNNVSLNVTTTDANLATCWYYTSDSATNITYTCNTVQNVSLTTGGNKVIYIWANDTAGTENSTSTSFLFNYLQPNLNYTTPVIEGENNTVYFNVTASSITSTTANLTYNGTDYTMTLVSNNGTLAKFAKNVTAPLFDADTSINLSVAYNINSYANSTINYSQLVYNIPQLNVTTIPCSDLALNFSLFTEGNLTAINGDFQYNFKYGTPNNNTFISQFGEITSANHFYVCVNNSLSNYNWELGEGQIFYSSTGYVDRRYYLFEGTNLSSGARNISLYDLLSSDQTSFKLEVEDTSLNAYADYFTTLVRWYPDLNQYNVVDMGLTDETGSTVIHVRTEDVDYRIGVYEKNGSLVKLADPIRMVCLVSPCTYTLKISPGETDYTSFLDIDYTFTYNETTGIWTFTFSDSTQKTSEMNLTIYKLTGTSVYPVCSNAVSAYSGALTCNTSIYTGTLKGVVLRSASPPVTLAEKIVGITTSAFSSSFGLWISLLIALPIIFIFAFMSPLGAVVGGVIALIPSLYFGAISWVILGGIAVLAGIVMHFLKRVG